MAGKTINVTDEASLLKSSGMKFLGELRQDGARPDAPESMRNDWGVVAGWLGHSAGELSAFQSDKLERAWVAAELVRRGWGSSVSAVAADIRWRQRRPTSASGRSRP